MGLGLGLGFAPAGAAAGAGRGARISASGIWRRASLPGTVGTQPWILGREAGGGRAPLGSESSSAVGEGEGEGDGEGEGFAAGVGCAAGLGEAGRGAGWLGLGAAELGLGAGWLGLGAGAGSEGSGSAGALGSGLSCVPLCTNEAVRNEERDAREGLGRGLGGTPVAGFAPGEAGRAVPSGLVGVIRVAARVVRAVLAAGS